jgi:hypothetical protein
MSDPFQSKLSDLTGAAIAAEPDELRRRHLLRAVERGDVVTTRDDDGQLHVIVAGQELVSVNVASLGPRPPAPGDN